MTLNRPDKSNALDRGMLETLNNACDRWEADPTVRVVVIRAAGKHFCSGADVTDVGHADRPQVTIPALCARIGRLGKPTIAAVHGACIGADVDLHSVHAAAFAGEEAREGLASFRDRRHPRWYLPRLQ